MERKEIDLPSRLYPNEFPQVGDIVMIKIIKYAENGVYCHVLEYNRDGFIPNNEISRKKIRNIRQEIRIGAQECAEVVLVDNKKGYVDLSRKMVRAEEKAQCQERYPIAKRLHNFFSRWSALVGENLVESILWPAFDGDSVDVYHQISENTEQWYAQVPEEYRAQVSADYYRTFEKKAEKHQVEFEVLCYEQEGAQKVQVAIERGMQCSTETAPLQCVYTGKTGKVGTIFAMSTVSKDDDAAEQVMTAVRVVEKAIGEFRSKFVIV